MKPDWKDAPGWARWLACDTDGEWWWFQLEPEIDEDGFWHSEHLVEWAFRNSYIRKEARP